MYIAFYDVREESKFDKFYLYMEDSNLMDGVVMDTGGEGYFELNNEEVGTELADIFKVEYEVFEDQHDARIFVRDNTVFDEL